MGYGITSKGATQYKRDPKKSDRLQLGTCRFGLKNLKQYHGGHKNSHESSFEFKAKQSHTVN